MPDQSVSTAELFDRLSDPETVIIDVRPIEAYNGWKLRNEIRGGHIRSARTLPIKWARYIDWIEIVRAKGILPHHSLVIYGYDGGQADHVADLFRRAGYPRVRTYLHFVDEWCGDDPLPMQYLPRYRHLVSARWLDGLMREGEASEYDNDRFLVCHAHYRNRGAYDGGHIPGAIEIDTNSLESQDTWNRRSPEEIKPVLEKLGITQNTTVIMYGKFMFPDNSDPFPGSSAGHLGAMRCAAIMMWAGIKDVRVLNGGYQSWVDAGLETTTEAAPKQPVADFGANIPAVPGIMVDLEEAKEILAADDKNLVSVRSWGEFVGEVSGYNYIAKKGRIPGAVFGNCGSDAYHMENYRHLDHTTREYHEIERLWADVGVTPDKHNAFYCGTGWRGSEAFFNAWLMGWPRVSVYDGGWFEWSEGETNPIETGIPHGYTESGRIEGDGESAY